VSLALRARGVRAVVLDIEGTTTPIAFVHDVLFPFARTHLHEYLDDSRNAAALADVTTLLASEHAGDLARGERPAALVEPYARWLMDRDRKSPGLKLLQGRIWERGYRSGQLKGEVFDDVVPAIRQWHDAGIAIAIYSSGSALAQRLLFESISGGDLTPRLSGFFDTGVGAKTVPESYARIAASLDHAAHDVLFVSDVTAELEAARSAGLQTLLSIRPGNPVQRTAGDFEAVDTFAGILP
jgi:enolase-phosphatase E1